ncbi:MAG TPA: hypothetical protein VN426_12515 [Syntrophomonadaceae bacterium]|nr:hypothetical protein [Syntrophomonadaceae bacterium]
MPWMHGNIELEDGSRYSGEFMIKEDGQMDSLFRPDMNEGYADSDEDELVSGQVNMRSPYQIPD